MPVEFPAWLSSGADAIRRLADRPWTLFILLLAINALARPASTTAHDARLYSLQALNQAEGGSYADDVFLRYGSQDQYSLFARAVGPIVAVIGLRPAFLALYLAFNALFILGLMRLVRALVEDPLIATVSLIFLVTAPLPYGGGDIFTVHEQFFTPRLISTALTLFALERLVAGQTWLHFTASFALLVAGALMHPLMAFGGMMIWAGCLVSCLPLFWAIGTLTMGVLVGIALLPVVGLQVFGELDDSWHQQIRVAVGYNYPDTWSVKDWLNLAATFVVPIVACCWLDPQRRRFVIIVILAGALGFLATVAASLLPYALLFQGQPYRVMWILKVIRVPLGFCSIVILLAGRSSDDLSVTDFRVHLRHFLALTLLGYFCVVHYIAIELMIFAIAVPASILFSRLADQPGGWWYGAARGLVIGSLGWMAYRWYFFATERLVIAEFFDLNEWVLFDLISPAFWLVGLCVAVWSWQALPESRALPWAGAAVAMIAPLAIFASEVSPWFQREHSRLGNDVAFMREFVREREADDGRRASVYWPLGRTDLVWIDVKATSYFSIIQTAGVIFNRDNANEINRRAQVVAKFEMARQREEALFGCDGKRAGMEGLFKVDFDCPPPTVADLVRLCQEPGLDFVFIPHEFPGLYSATNGRLFVYECYKVRAACGLALADNGLLFASAKPRAATQENSP